MRGVSGGQKPIGNTLTMDFQMCENTLKDITWITLKRGTALLLLAVVFFSFCATSQANDTGAMVGINFTHPLQLALDDQNATLGRMRAAGVKVIRVGFYAADRVKGVDFIKRARSYGINVLLTVHSQYPAGAPVRAYQPKDFPGMNQGSPLSSADPDLSGQFFQQLLDDLDSAGVTLAGLELENEINHPGFNAEFPLPGEGKTFTLDDLYHDPIGQRIATGYLQYIKIMTVLKRIRDNSKANRATPLISAGLSDTGPEGPWQKKFDAAGIAATIKFLRANGLDKLVDAYGIHTYPWADSPGDNAAAIHRFRRLQQEDLTECAVAGSSTGKPCFITEWGFTNNSRTCPTDEAARSLLVGELMSDFRQLVVQRKLIGVIYYTWTGDAAWDVYRCGQFTKPGLLAIQAL